MCVRFTTVCGEAVVEVVQQVLDLLWTGTVVVVLIRSEAQQHVHLRGRTVTHVQAKIMSRARIQPRAAMKGVSRQRHSPPLLG